MNRRSRRTAPSAWLARGALILGLIVTGWVAVSRSVAAAIRNDQPDAALLLAPNDSAALAAVASRLIYGADGKSHQQQAAALASRAITRDATAVSAISTLALVAEYQNDRPREARLFAYSQRLSRRDLTTQIYFVEDAVARGNVGVALRHYDIALRSSGEAQALMFPVLQGALTDDDLRKGLAALLATKPSWSPAFLSMVSTTGSDFVPTLALLSDLRRLRAPASADVVNQTLANLVGAHPDLAWRYYQGDHRGLDAIQPVNAGFNRATVDGSPFDWQLVADNGAQASLDQFDGKGVLSFSMPATASGVVAKQLRVLAPGSYRLETIALNITQPKESQPYWQITCNDGRVLGSVEIGDAPEAGARFSGTFAVPSDCKAQWLQLVVRPTDAVAGSSGAIDQVSIQRVGAAA